MRRVLGLTVLLAILVSPVLAGATPVPGTYKSTDLGGTLLTGRASTWRPGINSGLPHVLHAQSWDETSLGTQWEISCPIEDTEFTVEDNRVDGEGTIVYTSHFEGGTLTLFPVGEPWGDGTATLATTTLITTVQYMMIGGVSTPVASVINGNASGVFASGCNLTFAIGNGVGVGETTSYDPSITKPADYPTFLDDTCGPAPADQQFGSWGTVITITMRIDCPVPSQETTWGTIKATYR